METIGDYEYSTKHLLGHGAFAVVYMGRHKKHPNQPVAIKSITKKNIAKSQNLLSKEIKILQELTELHHENVVALLHCLDTSHHVYLVMEYCNGGDLADYLNANGKLREDTIRMFLKQLALAMRALVAKGIVHRDLKPQNILLSYAERSSSPSPHHHKQLDKLKQVRPEQITLKIADFGFARFLQDGNMAATLCGSPMYMAPEVIMSLQYDAKADLWSLGTIVFQCLTGKAPFQAQTPQALKQFYEKNVNLAPNIPSSTSPHLTCLLIGLLKRDSSHRLDFDAFFNHPFIRKVHPSVVATESSGNAVESGPTAAATISTLPVAPKMPDTRDIHHEICRGVSSSPPVGNLPPSELDMSVDHHITETHCANREMTQTLIKQSENTVLQPAVNTLSQDETDDFVMVPSNLPTEAEMAKNWARGTPSLVRVRKTSIAGSPAHKIPPNRFAYGTAGMRHSQILVQGISSTHSSSSTESYRTSDPVPVPSQKAAYHQMIVSASPEHAAIGVSGNEPSADDRIEKSQPVSVKKVSDVRAPDVASLSPPSIQFAYGTPPCGRRRSVSISSFSVIPSNSASVHRMTPTNSPVRHSGRRTPPHTLQPQLYNSPPCLPPIIGSPTKIPSSANAPDNIMGDICGNLPDHYVGGSGVHQRQPRRSSVVCPELPPDVTSGVLDMSVETNTSFGMLHRSRTEPYLLEWQPCDDAIGNHHLATYGHSAPPYLSNTNRGGITGLHPSLDMIPSDTVTFYAPPLKQETLLEKEHKETLAKLNFVLALVDYIIELAKSRASPFSSLRHYADGSKDELTPVPETQRKSEQLVLYVHALQLLSSALTLAKQEKIRSRLHPSNAVRSVVARLNQRFRQTLDVCKELNSSGSVIPIDPTTSSVMAEKLIYNYALDMCQSAALDELFGKPDECFRRYQGAQILLHALAEQVCDEADRTLLTKYKQAVERRLFLLQQQGLIHAYDTSIDN